MNHSLLRRIHPGTFFSGHGWRTGLITAKIGAFVALLLTLPAFAVEEAPNQEVLPSLTVRLKRMSVEELMAQQVTSVSRKPEAWSEAASNVFLVRGLGAPLVGANNLPQFLRVATNLFVAQSSSSQWAINARGFMRTNNQSNKLLVMIDGRSAYSPLLSTVFWDATSVFMPDLDHVEVISGPAGATWGANAVNGIISIHSKSARDTIGGLVTATGGTEVNNLGVRYGTKFGSNGAVRFYVQHSDYSATRSSLGVDDDYDSWKSTQGGFRADWGDASTGELTVQGDIFSGRYKNGSAADTVNDGANLLARWSRDLTSNSHLWIRAYHDYTERDTQSNITEITHTSDLEFQHRLDFDNGQELIWGGNYRRISDSIDHTQGFVILPADLDFGLGSIFAQHQVRLKEDRLRFTSGVRLEHNHFSGWETQPSIRAAWHQSGQTFWASASRATRIPSRIDTGIFIPATPPYSLAGGPGFRAEVLHAYELGWRSQQSKNLSFTTTFYYHDYDRLRSIEPDPVTAAQPYTIDNKVAGQSYGVEAFIDWDAFTWWRIRLGGFTTEQNTHMIDGGADVEKALGESSFPKYQVQFRNTFRFGKSFTLWTGLRHVAKVRATPVGGGEIPAYTELDAAVTWTARPGIDLTVSGHNLLDASHPEIGELLTRREITRSLQASVRWNF